ncbi:hypothetical protein [Falsiroseomonas selenitidurans]|uniref:PepSY domain-containing protein n=1 Tax=Falsiroseomonas selenitidurans TaxID=2716335 RepID=A0ABX1EFV3_9PROT|nr:hypothetical protein [Falsiroseomonas selenitidurans]NKC34402.1 hypothetical protein [Falsiroseomonas selenitidurans]
MKHLLSTTAMAAALILGGHGLAQAQSGTTAPMGSTMSSGSTTMTRMSEDSIRTALEARGYSDIEGLERDGDTFKVSEAQRYGKDVEDLEIDARTGQVRNEDRLTEDQARSMLSDRGYSDVSDVSRDGDTITAKAKRNDREVNLRIDANTGVVTQQQASN